MAIHNYTPSDIKRFWSKVDTSAGMFACWIWLGSRDFRGYGKFWLKGTNVRAHRASWKIIHGEIPEGLLVCHQCDNPSCVNPAHLWLGTDKDNADDRERKGRTAKGGRTRPKSVAKGFRNGRYTHPETTARGEKHGLSKLTNDLVREIRQRFANGETNKTLLASEYGVRDAAIGRIISRKTWRWLE